jgi:hypothetical protein
VRDKISIVHVSGYSLRQHPDLDVVDHTGQRVKSQYGDWEQVCWGDVSKGLLGRIPRALLEAYKTSSENTFIVWSTGSSRQRTGMTEAQYSMSIARSRISQLSTDFPEHVGSEGWFPLDPSPEIMESWLEQRSLVDNESINTFTSMQELAKIIDQLFSKELIEVTLVSSENHMPRVTRDAAIAIKYNGQGERVRPNVSLVYRPADTSWGAKTVHDTQVDDRGDYLVRR